MLQIFIYGPNEQGWLDLNPNTVMEVEETAEAFDEDLRTGIFTVPTEIPWTEKNRRLLGFSERLENFANTPKQFRCDVYDDGFPEIVAAQMTILEKNGAFSYQQGSFNASIAGTKGLYGTLIKNKSLKDLSLGGIIQWADKDSREFAYEVMTGAELRFPYIAFAPVAIENFIQTDRPDYNLEFLAKDTVNTIVLNSTGTDWVFGRPMPFAPTTAAANGTSEYIDYRTVPFFNLVYVLKQVFEEFNFKVSGAIVDSPGFEDLYIFNNFAIENYALTAGYYDLNTQITPSNHMPDIKIADFLRGVFALFNVYPSFQTAQEVKLVFRQSILTDRQIFSLNEVISKVFSSNFENNEPEDGYNIDYTWDSADQFHGDRVKDRKEKTFIGSVRRFVDLETLDPGRPLTTNDYAYVEAHNMYYNIANSLVTPKLWDAYAEGLDKFEKGKGERTVELPISTLCTYVEFDPTDALYEKRFYVGTRQPGTYRNNRGTLVENPFGLRLFFIKKQLFLYTILPMSYNHNRNNDDDVIGPFSLALNGEFGIANVFHDKWQEARGNAQIVKADIRVDQKILQEIDAANTLEHDSILFLPYKKERTIPNNGAMKMHLMLL